MTTTDRRDADDATFAAELARLDRLPVADEGAVERVARAMAIEDHNDDCFADEDYHDDEDRDYYRRLARVAVAALTPAPGTDTGPAYSDVQCHRGRHEDGGWYCVGHGQSWPCVAPGTDSSGRAVQRVEPGLSAESNGRRLAWFTDEELGVELTRRAAVASPQRDHGGQS